MNSGPLPLDGTYYLVVKGRFEPEWQISVPFAISVSPIAVEQGSLTLGVPVIGGIANAGQTDAYTFSVPTDTTIYVSPGPLASSNLTGNMLWTLSDSSGVIGRGDFNYTQSLASMVPYALEANRQYTLSVKGYNGTTSDYSMLLGDIASLPELPLNTDVSGQVPAGSRVFYRFDGDVGQALFFEPRSGNNSPWRVLDPNGRALFGPTTSFDSQGYQQVLEVEGTYLVVIEHTQTTTDSYNFRVTERANSATEIDLNEPIEATLTSRAERHRYTFELGARTSVYFDGQTSYYARWTLRGPNGVVVNSAPFDQSGAVWNGPALLDLLQGTYVLDVESTSQSEDTYRFELLNFAGAESYELGESIDRSLDPGAQAQMFRFSATAGQRVYMEVPGSNGGINWRIYDRFGKQVVAPSNLQDSSTPFVLELGGEYTLLFEGYFNGESSRNLDFNLHRVTPTVINFADADGEDAPPGYSEYTFTLGAPAQVYFDTRDYAASSVVTITGPSGQVVNRGFLSMDSVDATDKVAFNLAAGVYTVSIKNTESTPLTFRVLRLSEATAIQVGVATDPATSGVLLPGSATHVYSFEATAGQRIRFDANGAQGSSMTRWRLIDKYGNQVTRDSLRDSLNTILLTRDGPYTLLIEGYWGDTASSVSYSFRVNADRDGFAAAGTCRHGTRVWRGQLPQRDQYRVGAGPLHLYRSGGTEAGSAVRQPHLRHIE